MDLLTNIGNRPTMTGIGSDKFDVQKMLELELKMLEMKQDPYKKQKENIGVKKSAWEAFNNSLVNFNKLVEKAKDAGNADKSITYTSEGYFNVVASNKSIEGQYDIKIQQVATSQRISSDQVSDGPLGYNETVKINGKELEITSDMSMKDVIKEINNGEYGIKAISLNGQTVLTSEKTGAEGNIVLEGQLFKDIGLLTQDGAVKNEIQSATNALFTINGIEFERSENKVTDIEGLELNLIKATNSEESFTVGSPNEEIAEKVKEMIEGYNKLMGAIGELSGENKILQNSMVPRNLKNKLSNVFSEIFDGKSLESAGISFDTDKGGGLIKLDEEKLLGKLNSGDTSVLSMVTGNNGFTKKIYDIVGEFTSEKGMIKSEINSLTEKQERVQKTLTRFEDNFERQKEHLLLKYAKLDVLLKELEMKNSYIKAQLGQFEMDAKKR